MNVRRPSSKTIRCAVYVRRNTDAGRAADFNSICGQHKAIRDFIASRKSQGWICLPEPYEDVGQSGGTLERPALKRLLADIESGKVDCVVVHTFDRLTRSLADGAELAVRFKRCGVRLVVVDSVVGVVGSWR